MIPLGISGLNQVEGSNTYWFWRRNLSKSTGFSQIMYINSNYTPCTLQYMHLCIDAMHLCIDARFYPENWGVVGFPPTNGEHFEPWIWIRFSSSKVGSWYQPSEPTAFLFSGCNPYLKGLKPSFFTGTWGPIGKFLFFFWWIRGPSPPVFLREDGLSSKSLGGNLVQIRIESESERHLVLRKITSTASSGFGIGEVSVTVFFLNYKLILTLGASWIYEWCLLKKRDVWNTRLGGYTAWNARKENNQVKMT